MFRNEEREVVIDLYADDPSTNACAGRAPYAFARIRSITSAASSPASIASSSAW